MFKCAILYLGLYFLICFVGPSSSINGEKANNTSDYDKGVTHDGNTTNARRLHHSTHVDISEYPYVVSILRHGRHWCGGALITNQLVITTANCVWRRKSEDEMSIRLGSNTPKSGGREMYIKEIKRHPYWNISTEPYCDLAIIKMEEEVTFSATVHAAELPNVNLVPKYNDVWVTGFGTERADGIFPSDEVRLQVYHAELVNQTECEEKMRQYYVNLSSTFFCLSQGDEKAPCTRDSGSPAVSQGVVWGLASWGIRKKDAQNGCLKPFKITKENDGFTMEPHPTVELIVQCGTKTLPAMFTYLGAPENMDFIKAMTVKWQTEDATPAPLFYDYK